MLGLQLKRYRKHVLHITQHEMAAALETSASYISGLEVGQITNPGGNLQDLGVEQNRQTLPVAFCCFCH